MLKFKGAVSSKYSEDSKKSFSVNKIGLRLCVSSDKGGGGVREVAPPDTRTLEGIIPADYQQGRGHVPFQYDKSSDNIFYSKKKNKK